jgi:hypothetical protein
MEPEIATAVAVGIAIVNFVIWLFAFQAMLRATRERQALSAAADEQLIGTEERSTTIIAGSAEVPGGPDELAVKLAERLARDGLGSLGPIKITAANRTEVTFEAIGNPQGGSGLRRGSVRFSGAGNNTRIAYSVDAPSGRVLFALGWFFVALGLAAIVVALILEFIFAINSPHAAIRGQAVQMIQTVHFVWPPFLFAQLARQPIRAIKNHFEALINNLPYA